MRSRRVWWTLLVLSGAAVWLLWGAAAPLGIPGEWTWDRIGWGTSEDRILGWAAAGLTGLAYVLFAAIGAGRVPFCRRGELAVWLGALTAAGFGWLWIVQESPPAEYRLSKVPWVLYYPGSSGYFYEARYEMDGVARFLSQYENRMAEGDVLHEGTHPPGLFLMHRAFLELCTRSDRLTRMLLWSQPASVQDSLAMLHENTRFTVHPLTEPDAAALWLSALVTQFVAVATIVPLFLLLRWDYSRAVAWKAVCLWPLMPSLAVFFPKSDLLFPFLGAVFLVTWLAAVRRRSLGLSLAAGLLLWIGLCFSLALLPVAFVAALMTLWDVCLAGGDDARDSDQRRAESAVQRLTAVLALAGWAVLAFGLAASLLWLVGGINLFSVWSWNFHNHAGFYDEYPRTYWKWLIVNPLELAFAAGAPAFVAAVAAYRRLWQTGVRLGDRRVGILLSCGTAWGLLWLSGKNMGEAARLWTVVLPWVVWLAAGTLAADSEPVPTGRGVFRTMWRGWLGLLVLQVIVCVATVTRVDGFHLRRPFQEQQTVEADNQVG